MGQHGLRDLVRRRLFELGLSPHQASQRSGGELPAETIRGLARGQLSIQVGDRLAGALARALQVTEHRARRAAGLPVGEPGGDPTRPMLRLVRDDRRAGC